MDKNKKTIIAVTASLLLFFLIIFLVSFDVAPAPEEPVTDEVQEMTEEELVRFFSLIRGNVTSLSDNYFSMDVVVSETTDEDDEFDETGEYRAETISLTFKVTEDTQFVNDSEIHFVTIPQEYGEGLSAMNYLINTLEEDYVVKAYVEAGEEETEGAELTATYVLWSYYPLGAF